MTIHFASWPAPPQGRVRFVAACPDCGAEAEWWQSGSRGPQDYEIRCAEHLARSA